MKRKSLSLILSFLLMMVFSMSLGHKEFIHSFASETTISLEDARSNTNNNLFPECSVTENVRDSKDNGMTFNDGTYTMVKNGLYLRSTTVVNHELLGCNYLLLDNEKTETKTLDAYYKGVFKWSDVQPNRSCGLVLGKTTISTGEEVYLSATIFPNESKLGLYYYCKTPKEADQNHLINITSVTFAEGFNYTLEVVKSSKGISIYVNSKLITYLETFQNDQDGSTNPLAIETINLSNLSPTIGACFCDINCTLTNVAFKYLNPGTYKAFNEIDQDYVYATTFEGTDVYSLAPVKASMNKRDPNLNGFEFKNDVATMTYSGGWLRAINVFTNDYLDSSTLINNNDREVSTKGMDAYYKATFSFTKKNSDRILGLIVGKITALAQSTYLSVNICPASSYMCLYFNTKNPYDFTKQYTAPFSLVENHDYTLEVVIRNGVLKAFIDGKKYLEVSEYTVSAYGSDSVTETIKISNLTPCFGTNFMDIDATMKNFEFKYLEDYKSIKVYKEPDYPHHDVSYSYNTEEIIPDIPPKENNNHLGLYIACYSIIGVGGIGLIVGIVLLVSSRRKKHEAK